MTGLGGAHVLLTGATGFLGQAVLERLLSEHPDTTITVLVRRKGPASAADRVERLLRKDVFSAWRERVGADAARDALRDRVRVIDGDLGAPLPDGDPIDVVIHSASSVSFDPPVDRAFDANVTGAERLYRVLLASGSDPHVVHVSTAYVNGAQRGVAVEATVDHEVDWRAERAASDAARDGVEFASRDSAALRRFLRAAQHGVGRIGPHAVAEAAEEARRAWVNAELVARGRDRAQSLGWTDAYTLTKALGERVAEELWAGAGHRLSIVRPAIIESALRDPYPGWIDGFKVADPLILAYGRGQLREFPGLPDSILDIVPVDIVVSAILAAAAHPPAPAEPAYFHVASGARNPLTFFRMYENVHTFFSAHPIPSEKGPIEAPRWTFPGTRRFERALKRHEATVAAGEQVAARFPRSARARAWLERAREHRSELGVLRAHAELYRVYVQAEAIFDDTRLQELHARADDPAHPFDSSVIRWDEYLQSTHFPAITDMSRAFHLRSSRARAAAVELKEGTDVVAVFDLEGTVLRANLVDHYLRLRLVDRAAALWPREVLRVLATLPRYLAAERRDRSEFIRTFVRLYRGMKVADIRRHVDGPVGRHLRSRLLTDALERVAAHRRAGHHTVLVTGTVDLFSSAVAEHFDEVVASRLQERDGVLNGYLESPPIVGEARAAWLRQYADQHGFILGKSYGYGDSVADTSWMSLVGTPVAVNPDAELYRRARAQRWEIVSWRSTGPAPETTPA